MSKSDSSWPATLVKIISATEKPCGSIQLVFWPLIIFSMWICYIRQTRLCNLFMVKCCKQTRAYSQCKPCSKSIVKSSKLKLLWVKNNQGDVNKNQHYHNKYPYKDRGQRNYNNEINFYNHWTECSNIRDWFSRNYHNENYGNYHQTGSPDLTIECIFQTRLENTNRKESITTYTEVATETRTRKYYKGHTKGLEMNLYQNWGTQSGLNIFFF